jgi:KDO2-lipid IV(A) lauroyltransferase
MTIKYWLEYIGLMAFLGIAGRLCPLKSGVRFGSIIAKIGVRLSKNRVVVRNIQNALHVDDKEAMRISKGMWSNLGRILFEYPHLEYLAKNNVTFQGDEHLKTLTTNKGGILFGGHLGNWEIISHSLIHHHNIPVHPVYRAPNNPMVDKKLQEYRSTSQQLASYSKSKPGMIGMIKALKQGGILGLLIDQKLNEGVTVPFFDMNANTGIAFIDMAKKFDCPLVPMRSIRTESGFIMDVCPPIETKNRDTLDILNDVHALLEQWIREYPEQWLWLHRRWKTEELKHV